MLRGHNVFNAAGIIAAVLTPTFLHAQDVPRTSVRTSEIRTVTSTAVEGFDYEIVVSVPKDYESSSDRYPVVYYLDAWYLAGGVEETYHWLRAFDDIPPLILVGVSWRTDGPGAHFNRTRDYTPTEDPSAHTELLTASGGGESFLSFITDELIPLIEREYRTDDSSRGLFGRVALGHRRSAFRANQPGSDVVDTHPYRRFGPRVLAMQLALDLRYRRVDLPGQGFRLFSGGGRPHEEQRH